MDRHRFDNLTRDELIARIEVWYRDPANGWWDGVGEFRELNWSYIPNSDLIRILLNRKEVQ